MLRNKGKSSAWESLGKFANQPVIPTRNVCFSDAISNLLGFSRNKGELYWVSWLDRNLHFLLRAFRMFKKIGMVMLFLAACAVSFNFTGCKPKKLGKVEVNKRAEKMEHPDEKGEGASVAVE